MNIIGLLFILHNCHKHVKSLNYKILEYIKCFSLALYDYCKYHTFITYITRLSQILDNPFILHILTNSICLSRILHDYKICYMLITYIT